MKKEVKNKYYEIITEENPFSLDYNDAKIIKLLQSEKVTKGEKDVLEFFSYCHQLFLFSNTRILDVFENLSLSKEELISFIFKALNGQTLKSIDDIYKQLSENNSRIVSEKYHLSKFVTESGNTLMGKDILENGGNVLNILVEIINFPDMIFKEKNKLIDIDEKDLMMFFYELWYYAMHLYSFNSFYEIIKYQNGIVEIDKTKNIIKIKSSIDFKRIQILSTISEIRDGNHINEYQMHLNNIDKKLEHTTILNYTLHGDCIIPTIGTRKNSYKNIRNFSKYLKSNNYLENLKLDYYEDLTLYEIYKVIVIIIDLIDLILSRNVNSPHLKLNEIPFRIEKNILIKSIEDCTKISITAIDKILNSITENKSKPYFWRKPLLKNEGNIYLSFSLLSAPNLDLLLESIIEEANINNEFIIKSFKESLRKELLEDKIEYFFSEIEIDKTYLQNNLLYELSEYYILIEINVLRIFPIESNEINYSLELLNVSSEKLKEKTKKLGEELKIDKPILPIILVNYTKFSGLVLNEISILDTRLLKNYFIVGEFIKTQIKYSKGKPLVKIFNQIKYYNCEEDFNKNFLSFIIYPIPIMELYNKMSFEEVSASPPDAELQIILENYEFLDDENFVSNELDVLKNLLNYQYYNNTKDKENQLYTESINYHLTNVFHLIAFGEYDLSIYRFDISDVFQKSKIHGFWYLINYFRKALSQLNKIRITNDKKFNSVLFDTDDTLKLIYDEIFSKKLELRLSEFSIDENIFSKKQEKEILSLVLNVLSTISIEKIENDILEQYISFLHILSAYRVKYQLYTEFYSACSNLIANLNFDFKYQLARNLSEEILLVSMKDKMTHKGWGILFQVLDQQKNIYDATIYGCLYITSLSVETKLNYSEIVDVFYNVLKFARNAKVNDLVDEVFKFLKTIRLKTYDEQKIYLSYYLSIIYRKEVDSIEIINSSIDYFRANSKKIIQYKEKGAFPWLNYFYNIKRLKTDGLFKIIIDLDDIINELESVLTLEAINTLKELHFGTENLKESFIKKLKNILETYSYNDYVFEIQNLELFANHLIENGIKENDAESLLLSGFVFNDITLMYKNTFIQPNTKVIFNSEIPKNNNYLDNYLNYTLDRIDIKENQIFLYLFTHKNSIFGLIINSSKTFKILDFKNWSLQLMNKWLKKKDKFYFNSNNYYDITEQESSYNKLLNELCFSELNIDDDFDELLISTSLDLSKFPINLILDKNNFLGSSKPIANVLLLDWYVNNNIDTNLKKGYTMSAWIPIEDKDPDIIWGYEKIKPILLENNVNIISESYPKKMINSDVNIFLAHGELNQLGFKAVYKSDNVNSAVFENRELFGKGEIAILFICNSGSMNEDLFSNSIVSLVHEIIQLGYKSVIAPCWSLEVTIPEFWLDGFLTNFNEGFTISESVYLANNKLSDYKESISSAYLVPEGRLAMHLYGNPNIKIENV